jgi:hypothetical protein
VVLLVSAGLLLKSYMRLRSNDLGCATDNILTMHFTLPEAQYSKPAQRMTFFDDLLTRVRALPGVQAAGLVRAVPGEGYFGDAGIAVAEHPPLPQGQSQIALVRRAEPSALTSVSTPRMRSSLARSSYDSTSRMRTRSASISSATAISVEWGEVTIATRS